MTVVSTAWKDRVLVGTGLLAVLALVSSPAFAENPPKFLGNLDLGARSHGGLAFLESGDFVVHVDGSYRLRIYTPSGSMTQIVPAGSADGQLQGRGGVAAAGDLIYVCDLIRKSVEVFTLQGDFVRRILPAGGFLQPVNVSIGPDGTVYVLDRERQQVFRFDSDGMELGSFGATLVAPRGLDVDDNGSVYVGDNDPAVKIYDGQTGVLTGFWSLPDRVTGLRGHGDTYYPTGEVTAVTVAEDAVYVSVAPFYLGLVFKMSRNGEMLSRFEDQLIEALDLDAEGDVHVLRTRSIATWAGKPYTPPPYEPFTGATAWLHIATPVAEPSCSAVLTSARHGVTRAPAGPKGQPYHIYLVGSPAPGADAGLTGFQLGVSYESQGGPDGLMVQGWNLCSDLEFAPEDWPESGTGNTVTWAKENCQRSDVVIAGYFEVVAQGASVMWLTPYPVTGIAKVANCSGGEGIAEVPLPPENLGWVSLGGGTHGGSAEGCNPAVAPCLTQVPVRPATWSQIKQTFGN